MTKKEAVLNRFIAKGIDFFVVAFLWVFLVFFEASYLGMLAGISYILIADGFFDGQSLGKKLVKIRVVMFKDEQPSKCSFKGSIVRNSLLAVVIFAQIPFIGWFIFLPIGILILAIEAYFCYTDENGKRIGDVLAGTIVEDLSGE